MNAARLVSKDAGRALPVGIATGRRRLWLSIEEALELAHAVLAAVVEINSIGSHPERSPQ